MIKEEFFTCLQKYTSDKDVFYSLWREVEDHYTSTNRHYHTLQHLHAMLADLLPYKQKFSNWSALIFGLVYHDVIYSALKRNNEELSAELAVKRLRGATIPEKEILSCEKFILATKSHEAQDYETNLFTDADLAILGADPDVYKTYTCQIRHEYSIYPDALFIPGRKVVVMRFLGMKKIYKTSEFSHQYEAAARRNLQQELSSLSK